MDGDKKFTFKKSTCERYDIRFGQWGWAIITIDENGGLFNAQSDYGNYSYSWPGHGRKSFKHFILELAKDSSYFLNKVADDNFYYQYETETNWKKRIIEDRKEGELTKEKARVLFDITKDVDFSTAESCVRDLYDHKEVWDIYPEPWYIFNAETGYSPIAIRFAKEVMPMFAEILREEIQR
ncbi:hypothetical protein [Petroclostridium sp. X23]|uniref:hypothetical protein n=1 Tax=Petroclostridium sp. X23 TaxID=3045146 RepID=UPI0024AE62A2|nr:hypothetical protein [Petroclostridium sp. X23]WHH59135.1 hypothetical protein QKW49_25675 [Petroclostridium sp. X23]